MELKNLYKYIIDANYKAVIEKMEAHEIDVHAEKVIFEKWEKRKEYLIANQQKFEHEEYTIYRKETNETTQQLLKKISKHFDLTNENYVQKMNELSI